MKIVIFRDPAVQGLASYTEEDAAISLASWAPVFANTEELQRLDSHNCEVLVLACVNGAFPKSALTKVISLHQEGVGLLILGDIPHDGNWYPYRRNYAFELNLTRCQDPITLTQLTAKGEEIIGELKNWEGCPNKSCVGLRITGFPEDRTYNLIHNNEGGWEFPTVVAIERRGEKFFGAKVGVLGFNGGEPRENASGCYKKEWTFNPGLLNRDWPGIHSLVNQLCGWCGAQKFAASLMIPQVSGYSRELTGTLLLRSRLEKGENHHFSVCVNGKFVWKKSFEVRSFQQIELSMRVEALTEGENQYTLLVDDKVLETGSFFRLSIGAPQVHRGSLGFSTYHSFKESHLSEEYKSFVRSLKDRGAQYFRVSLPWEDIEPAPGVYHWGVPDEMIDFANVMGLKIQFWLFPTTRGSGLADAGVPEWVLEEPALDRNGKAGYFPTLWSPFYRRHYFTLVEKLCERYGKESILQKFVIDFGNSDFPYGYYYYGNDDNLFDYSPIERDHFCRYLKETCGMSLHDVAELTSLDLKSWDEVRVPFSEQKEAWLYYLRFRSWSIQNGMSEIEDIIRRICPSKLSQDLPGHGLGSISDISTAWYDPKSRYWDEENSVPYDLKYQHNAGPIWGGEAWQVGASYKEYDDALFNSIRFNASYFTLPGPDLNVYGDDISRICYIRREMCGAQRKQPAIAVLGRGEWWNSTSLPQVALRLDTPCDYISLKHRYNFKRYKLLVMPSQDFVTGCEAKVNGGYLLPLDVAYYKHLYESVVEGMNLLLFPDSWNSPSFIRNVGNPRKMFCIGNNIYTLPQASRVSFPPEFGGGEARGLCRGLVPENSDKILIRDENGRAILLQRPLGKGSILLAGWDDTPESIDGECKESLLDFLEEHSFNRLLTFLGLAQKQVDTNNGNFFKELLYRSGELFLVIRSENDRQVSLKLNLPHQFEGLKDLGRNEIFPLTEQGNGSFVSTFPLWGKQSRYFKLS